MRIFRKLLITLTAVSLAGTACQRVEADSRSEYMRSQLPDRPNILLIVADDLGYSDIGPFGGEIDTPNLSALAESGIKLSNFYAAPACSPTRAMLFSGVDSHRAGLGNMLEQLKDNQRGQPGYEGFLNFRVAPLAAVLRDAGYRTYMTGKWHLGQDESTSPFARGFDRSFALLDGGAGHLDMMPMIGPGIARYRKDANLISELPSEFYSTEFFTHKLIEYIDGGRDDERPFFAYLAYTAPHWPLQAPPESIEKYRGRYDDGYDNLHSQRLSRLKELRLLDEGTEQFPRPSDRSWDELDDDEKRYEARKMEIYAAMVNDMDRYIGEVVDYLKLTGEYSNTFILFLSDNGAAGGNIGRDLPAVGEWIEQCCDNSYENLGRRNSFVWTGPNWAWASSAPSRMYKGFASEGGIKVPAIAHFPKEFPTGLVIDELVTVKDVMPTILEIAKAQHPGSVYNSREVLPMTGTSMFAVLQGRESFVHDSEEVFGWELFGRRAVRQGNWKLLWQKDYTGANGWQLYDLNRDPGELYSVAETEPEKLQQMLLLWDRYVEENGIILPPNPGSNR